MKVKNLTCTLQSSDLNRSAQFYQSLGFELEWMWPKESPTHASIKSGDQSFMMVRVDTQAQVQKGDLYFTVENVHDVHKQLKKLIPEVMDLEQADYGMLDFSLKDPDGHHIVFGMVHGDFIE